MSRRIAILAGLGGLLFGYDTGVIGGAQLFIKKDFHLSNFSDEVLVSCVLVGAIIGAAAAGAILSRFGRRRAITIAGLLFVVGSVAAAAAPGADLLDAARIIVGVAIGLVSVAAPLYVAETAPAARRGAMVALYQLAITIGIFSAYLVDEALSTDDAWRAMFAIGIVPAVLLILGMRTLPESPRWLVEQDRDEEARSSLSALAEGEVDAKPVEEQLAAIQAARQADGAATWRSAFTASVRPALIVAVALALIQQLTGINTVIYYAPTIFRSAGINSNSAAIWASVTVSIVNVTSTFIAIRFVDRVGRKPLLAIGLTGMTFALGALALVFAIGGDGHGFGIRAIVTIAALWVYVACFAFSLGPIVWIVISEIFPSSARGPGNSVATMVGWSGNLLVSITFLSLIDVLGDSGTFALYGAIALASIVFIRLRVPETRGRTLEEIEGELIPARVTPTR